MFARALLISALACVALGEWTDLFQPPFANGPSVMMAIGCVSSDHCYVAGGANGVGAGIFLFDGSRNGQFQMLTMPQPNLMDMAIAVGGNPSAPHGVAGGIGFGNSIEYFYNATELLPATTPEIFFTTQDARADRATGMNILVVDSMQNSAMYSTNGGMNFTESKINVQLPSESEARYGAVVDSQTWYISLGNWPDDNSNSNAGQRRKGTRLQNGELSARVSVSRTADGTYKRHSKSMLARVAAAAAPNDGYSASIVKTTNGGQSWQLLFSVQTNFYFNGIDCLNATWCVAVGEGFDEGAAGHVYLTKDGMTWNQIYSKQSTQTGSYSFMSVRFSTPTQVWIGGSLESNSGASGIFLTSMDAGMTWLEPGSPVPYVADVMDMNFLADGTGFATAVTVFQDSTILKYYNGPAPTLAPGSPGSVVLTQQVCLNAQCTFLCQTNMFPTLECLQVGQGQSVFLNCTGNNMVQQTIYQNSGSCSGNGQTSMQALNTCTRDNQGNYFQDSCGPAPPGFSNRQTRYHF